MSQAHDYYGPGGTPELHNHGEGRGYIEPDYLAQEADDQLPMLSTLGCGPRGHGVWPVITKDADGEFLWQLVDDVTGEAVMDSPNLSAGKIEITQPDRVLNEGETGSFDVHVTRGKDVSTYTVDIPAGAHGSRIYLLGGMVERRPDETYTCVESDLTVYGGRWDDCPPVRVGDIVVFSCKDSKSHYLAFGTVQKASPAQVAFTSRTKFEWRLPYIGANGNWFVDDEDTGVAAQGPQGPAGEFGAPVAKTLPAGAPATARNLSENPHVLKLEVGVPKGEKGDQGTFSAPEAVQLDQSQQPTVEDLDPDPSNMKLKFGIPAGKKAVVKVGGTETLQPGAPASVGVLEDEGDNSYTLNFGIPEGLPGKSIKMMQSVRRPDELPPFEDAEVNGAYVVDDGDGRYDLYVRGLEPAPDVKWTIVRDWQGEPGKRWAVVTDRFAMVEEFSGPDEAVSFRCLDLRRGAEEQSCIFRATADKGDGTQNETVYETDEAAHPSGEKIGYIATQDVYALDKVLAIRVEAYHPVTRELMDFFDLPVYHKLPVASKDQAGIVSVGDNIDVDGAGKISVPVATDTTLGVAKGDGNTVIVNEDGSIETNNYSLFCYPGLIDESRFRSVATGLLLTGHANEVSIVLTNRRLNAANRQASFTVYGIYENGKQSQIASVENAFILYIPASAIWPEDGKRFVCLKVSATPSGTTDKYEASFPVRNIATNVFAGTVRPGATTNISMLGTINVNAATSSSLGAVKPDGTTITVDADGTVHSVAPDPYVLPVATPDALGGIKVRELESDVNTVSAARVQADANGMALVPRAHIGRMGAIKAWGTTHAVDSTKPVADTAYSPLRIDPNGVGALPIASGDKLGMVGVKDGSGISLDEAGYLSVPPVEAGGVVNIPVEPTLAADPDFGDVITANNVPDSVFDDISGNSPKLFKFYPEPGDENTVVGPSPYIVVNTDAGRKLTIALFRMIGDDTENSFIEEIKVATMAPIVIASANLFMQDDNINICYCPVLDAPSPGYAKVGKAGFTAPVANGYIKMNEMNKSLFELDVQKMRDNNLIGTTVMLGGLKYDKLGLGSNLHVSPGSTPTVNVPTAAADRIGIVTADGMSTIIGSNQVVGNPSPAIRVNPTWIEKNAGNLVSWSGPSYLDIDTSTGNPLETPMEWKLVSVTQAYGVETETPIEGYYIVYCYDQLGSGELIKRKEAIGSSISVTLNELQLNSFFTDVEMIVACWHEGQHAGANIRSCMRVHLHRRMFDLTEYRIVPSGLYAVQHGMTAGTLNLEWQERNSGIYSDNWSIDITASASVDCCFQLNDGTMTAPAPYAFTKGKASIPVADLLSNDKAIAFVIDPSSNPGFENTPIIIPIMPVNSQLSINANGELEQTIL